ncbi:MAG: hypothetical protein R3E92_22140 [Burkholderiaceae bacterium]
MLDLISKQAGKRHRQVTTQRGTGDIDLCAFGRCQHLCHFASTFCVGDPDQLPAFTGQRKLRNINATWNTDAFPPVEHLNDLTDGSAVDQVFSRRGQVVREYVEALLTGAAEADE